MRRGEQLLENSQESRPDGEWWKSQNAHYRYRFWLDTSQQRVARVESAAYAPKRRDADVMREEANLAGVVDVY